MRVESHKSAMGDLLLYLQNRHKYRRAVANGLAECQQRISGVVHDVHSLAVAKTFTNEVQTPFTFGKSEQFLGKYAYCRRNCILQKEDENPDVK